LDKAICDIEVYVPADFHISKLAGAI